MSGRIPVGLGTKLRQLIMRLDSEVQEIYDDMNVTFRPRFYPVVSLLCSGPQSVNAIAQVVGVSQPATTQTLGEMKKLGLIKVQSGADRRTRLIHLTAKGKAVVRKLEPVWDATHRAATGLESELPAELGAIVDQTLAALDRKPFKRRIRAELGGKR